MCVFEVKKSLRKLNQKLLNGFGRVEDISNMKSVLESVTVAQVGGCSGEGCHNIDGMTE